MNRHDQDRALLVAALDRQRARNPKPPPSGLSVCSLTYERQRCTYITGHEPPCSWDREAQERQQLEDALERARETSEHRGPTYRYLTGDECPGI